jgi:Secretion system C-terminal sorting domain/NHL repeat
MKYIILIISILFVCQTKAQTISTVVGNNTSGFFGDGGPATNAEIASVAGYTFDLNGNLVIADGNNYRIRRVNSTTGDISTICGDGVPGFSGDGGMCDTATLNMPLFMACDKFGNLFFSDVNNDRIRKIDSNGIITTYAGNGLVGSTGDGSAATSASLVGPFGVAVDLSNNLYICDFNGCRIRKVNGATGFIETIAGTGVAGFSGDGGAATAAALNFPVDIAFDRLGNFYIADQENFRIRKVDVSTGLISTVAGTGAVSYTGDGIQATAAAISPRGVAIDSFGNIFISEWSNDRIRKVDASSGIISTFAGTGVLGYSGDGGSASAAQFKYLYHLQFDRCGDLYVADVNNFVLRKITIPPALPTLSISTSSDTFCTGSTLVFNAATVVGVTGTAGYQWYVNGSAVPGATAASYGYSPAGGDSVRCVLTFTSPCMSTVVVSSNSLYLTASSAVTPVVTLPASPVYASVGSTVTVNATVADTPATYVMDWYNRGVFMASTSVPQLVYTKAMAIDSITAHMAESEVCFDSAVSGVCVVVDSVLGVRGVAAAANAGLLLTPNPAGGPVTVTAPGFVKCITVTDMMGRTLLVQPCNAMKSTIDLSNFPAGTYFVKADAWVGRLVKE